MKIKLFDALTFLLFDPALNQRTIHQNTFRQIFRPIIMTTLILYMGKILIWEIVNG